VNAKGDNRHRENPKNGSHGLTMALGTELSGPFRKKVNVTASPTDLSA
jgi:hypothetical protein